MFRWIWSVSVECSSQNTYNDWNWCWSCKGNTGAAFLLEVPCKALCSTTVAIKQNMVFVQIYSTPIFTFSSPSPLHLFYLLPFPMACPPSPRQINLPPFPLVYSPAWTRPLFCLAPQSLFSATSHQFELHAAFYHPPPPVPYNTPPPHILLSRSPSIHPLLLITTQFHSRGGPCVNVCVCVCSWAKCDQVSCQQIGAGRGIWV